MSGKLCGVTSGGICKDSEGPFNFFLRQDFEKDLLEEGKGTARDGGRRQTTKEYLVRVGEESWKRTSRFRD